MTRRGLFGLLAAAPAVAKIAVEPHNHDWQEVRSDTGLLLFERKCRTCGAWWMQTKWMRAPEIRPVYTSGARGFGRIA